MLEAFKSSRQLYFLLIIVFKASCKNVFGIGRGRRQGQQGPRAGLRRLQPQAASRSTTPGWTRCSRRLARSACRCRSTRATRKAFWLPVGPGNERLEELRGPPRLVELRASPCPRGRSCSRSSSAGWRATRGSSSSACISATRPRSPRGWRPCSTSTRTISSTPPPASPRSGGGARRRCGSSSSSTRIASCSGPTSASASSPEALMLGSTGEKLAAAADVDALLRLDLPLLRDRRSELRPPHADPGELGDQRHQAAARGAGESLPPKCRETAGDYPYRRLASAASTWRNVWSNRARIV